MTRKVYQTTSKRVMWAP
uniref:Uncharacterized protein n=1 Tax=Arundo donax TaxID=35708 RepID=A0A0A9C7V4_ARUDO